MSFQLDLVSSGVGFVAGLLIGFVVGLRTGRKRPRGATVAINNVTCKPPPMVGAAVNVTVDYDSHETLLDLWSQVFAAPPTPAQLAAPAPGATGYAQSGATPFTTDVLVNDTSGYVVIWAHMLPPPMHGPLYYAHCVPKQFHCP
jgi:hypothetical protein